MTGSTMRDARAEATRVFRGRRAILFDLDGTLYGGADAAAYFEHADEVTGLRVRARLGLPTARAAFDALEDLRRADPTLRSKSEVLERRFGVGLAEMNRFRERFTDPEAMLRADPRAAALISALAERYVLALGTNNTPRLARRILAVLGVDPRAFAVVLASEDVGAAKPDARFFAAVAARTSIPFEAFASVGDRPESDLEPAAALGAATWRVEVPDDLYALEALVAR